MGDTNRKVNCHNCKLDSYEILNEIKGTTVYLCRLCKAMEVVDSLEGNTSICYKSYRTEIVIKTKRA
jgi:hypothetical protein